MPLWSVDDTLARCAWPPRPTPADVVLHRAVFRPFGYIRPDQGLDTARTVLTSWRRFLSQFGRRPEMAPVLQLPEAPEPRRRRYLRLATCPPVGLVHDLGDWACGLPARCPWCYGRELRRLFFKVMAVARRRSEDVRRPRAYLVAVQTCEVRILEEPPGGLPCGVQSAPQGTAAVPATLSAGGKLLLPALEALPSPGQALHRPLVSLLARPYPRQPPTGTRSGGRTWQGLSVNVAGPAV